MGRSSRSPYTRGGIAALILILLGLGLAGCGGNILGMVLSVGAIYDAERTTPATGVPELDPSRRVSEQDCTQPVDYSLGNLRCK